MPITPLQNYGTMRALLDLSSLESRGTSRAVVVRPPRHGTRGLNILGIFLDDYGKPASAGAGYVPVAAVRRPEQLVLFGAQVIERNTQKRGDRACYRWGSKPWLCVYGDPGLSRPNGGNSPWEGGWPLMTYVFRIPCHAKRPIAWVCNTERSQNTAMERLTPHSPSMGEPA